MIPYSTNKDLPDRVRKSLPQGAQTIFREAYNNAAKQYVNPSKRRGDEFLEEVCNKVAWSAVKKTYIKKGDKWVKKE